MSKELNEFHKDKRLRDGLKCSCKECEAVKARTKNRTKEGLIKKMYNQQVKSSKRRGHPKPTYTRKELTAALLDMPLFHKLYGEWVDSDYNTYLVPSIDRDNNFLSYTEDNITLMTWKENRDKGYKDLFEGNSTQCKPILQLSLSGKSIKKFKSAAIAGRVLGIDRNTINKVCRGELKTAGGYRFIYL